MRCQLACLVLFGLLAVAPPAEAQQRLSLNDARAFAADLIAGNQPAAARDIALGLLQANPDDIDALILLSRAERLLRNTSAAVAAGQAAWALATTDAERFVTASVMAQAHSSAENYSRAQIWLRRAADAAPTAQMQAVAARDYGIVRQANPLSVSLSFGAAPTSNVNNGNSNSAITFAYLPGALANIAWEVPADDRPLSGIGLSGQAQVSYRLSESPTSRTTIELGLYGQTTLMSESAKTNAPDVTGHSLSYQQASVGLIHSWAPQGGRDPYSVDLSYTQSVYAGSPYTRDISATLARQWQRGEHQTWSASAGANRTIYSGDGSMADGVTLRGAWSRDLGNDRSLSLSASTGRIYSDRPDRGYAALGFQAGYDFGTIGAGIDLSVSASLEGRSYDTSSYDPVGRSDVRSAIQVSLGLPEMAFYGFEPVVTMTANRTSSSVPYFETEGIKMAFQIRSSF